jgi:hypothetical protein
LSIDDVYADDKKGAEFGGNQQVLKEMQQADFVATLRLFTVWGTKPASGESMLIHGLK